MRVLLAAVLILGVSAPAAAQSKDKDYRPLIRVYEDETGRVANSAGALEVREKWGSSPDASSITGIWVEARRQENGPTQVFLVGERVRFITSRQAEKRSAEYGPSDPPDPVFVGSPWKEADLRYRGAKVECLSRSSWCYQKWYVEVALPESVVRSVVTDPKMNEVRLSLSNRRWVEWRTPRDELIATLDALAVLHEFSEPAK